METQRQSSLFQIISKYLLILMVAMSCGAAIGEQSNKQQNNDEFTLDEITVTAQFQETNLQETPLAITAITGETLELQDIQTVADLGLVVPNANIRAQGNAMGPNAQIGLRGVGQYDFIPAFEPGVGVYVDDIYQETLVGSTLDLLDLQRVEVLRGPQGTLFGKNSLGGAIRLISKLPMGDNTGHIQVTKGNYNRLDFSGAYDFSLIDDVLFMRISGSSKKIDGYEDRLDYTCQMIANGTPELAGSFPSTLRDDKIANGDCKIGEKGGSDSEAAKIMLRYLPSHKLEINIGADYTDVTSDVGAETMLRGFNPTDMFDSYVQDNYIDPTWNLKEGDALTILGDPFVTGNPYTVYESFEDPINGIRWPDKNTEEYKNAFARVDYDLTEDIHLKGIFGYRKYEQVFVTANNTPFAFNAYLIDMKHKQTSYEVRLNGKAFDKLLDWTTGIYYFKSDQHFGGYIGLGTFGIWSQDMGLSAAGFSNNDFFTTESKSAFVHGIFHITEKLSFTTGGRYTSEDKTFTFDHIDYLELSEPLAYGGDHYDWKLGLDYQFTDDIMAYFSASTGFRSEGANPRPYSQAQLQEITGEKILAYEVGAKTDFFDNRLRINGAAFINDYDPRQFMVFGAQCTAIDDFGPPVYAIPYGTLCPAGTAYADTTGSTYAMIYLSAPGTSKGLEFDVTARPFRNLDINGSFGYYDFESDVSPDNPGYVDPDYKDQARYSYNIGAQYRIVFHNGSMLVPRIDMFYQGERNNNSPSSKPIAPYHVVPAYTVYNARLTYMPPDTHWSLALEVQNLFDKFYWVQLGSDRADDGITPTYTRTGVPSPPRMLALTLRYNIF